MARKTQQEVNFWFQDNTIKSALDLSLIEKVLHINNLDIPNNIIIHKNGSTYDDFAHWYCDEIKISKYPTTYKECCDVLLIPPYYNLRYHTYERGYNEYATSNELLALQDKLNTLGKLIICRNAYWKIYGEEMGLGNPWEPDWSSFSEGSYPTITKCNGRIVKTSIYTHDCPLAFPTEEMRNVFYENFKDLIELCKTLL